MRRLFSDYKKEVIEAYISKRDTGQLSLNLSEPTPASLRDECLDRYKESYSQKDDESLRKFFGPKGNNTDYYQIIWNAKADKFKPLANFLKDLSINTKSKNIELLAWLIDFQPRPFQFIYEAPGTSFPNDAPWNQTLPGQKGLTPTNDDKDEKSGETSLQGKGKKMTEQSKKRWSTISRSRVVLFIFVASATVWGAGFVLKAKYMYWNGEEYKRVSHWKTVVDTPIEVLDKHRLANFKKITRTDTLTKKDINNVWYTKIAHDSIEFYTDSATHPIYPNKKLNPMTEYIWIKWVKNRYH